MAPTYGSYPLLFHQLSVLNRPRVFLLRPPSRSSVKKHVLNHHSAHTPSILLQMRVTYPAILAGYEIPKNTWLFAHTRSPKPASRYSSRENPSQ